MRARSTPPYKRRCYQVSLKEAHFDPRASKRAYAPPRVSPSRPEDRAGNSQ